jgi:hypothetical protein
MTFADMIRLECPELAGELDVVVVMFLATLPPDLARRQAHLVAQRVRDIRAGRRRPGAQETA